MIDKLMALADQMMRDSWSGLEGEVNARAALRAAITEALDMGEPVAWQYKWLNPGNQENQIGLWAPVEPYWNQTMQEKITELEAYRYSGKPCYEVRVLYAAKEPK